MITTTLVQESQIELTRAIEYCPKYNLLAIDTLYNILTAPTFLFG